MNCLMIDATTEWDSEDLASMLGNRAWASVYVLLSDEHDYALPALSFGGAHKPPPVHPLLVPRDAEVYSFAAGFLHAQTAAMKVWFLTHCPDTGPLKPLKRLRGVEVQLVRRARKPVEEEEAESDADEEAPGPTPGDTMMRSLMDFLGTDSGQNLVANMLQQRAN